MIFCTPEDDPKIWGCERVERRADATLPILVKTLDVRGRLSVQVHPGAAAASALGGREKNEMWCILEPGTLYAGFKPGTGEGAIRRAIAENTLDRLLVRIEAKKYETYFIPAGLVHAAQGVRFFEVQQDSDTTYRLYDWGSVDAQGRPRRLHIEESMASLDAALPPPSPVRDLETPWFSFAQKDVVAGGALDAPQKKAALVFDAAARKSFLLAPGERAAVAPGRYFMAGAKV